MAASHQTKEEQIQALAASIHDLSKTYDGSSDASRTKFLSKAKDLISALQTPMDHATACLTSLVEVSAIRALISLQALQAIPASGFITLSELEAKSGAQASLLQRLFRILVISGLVTYKTDNGGSFAHTVLSMAYTKEMGPFITYTFDECAVLTQLPAYFKARGKKEPDGEKARTYNPQTWFHGQEGKTAFEIMEQDPEKLAQFQQVLALAEKIRPYTGFYDYGKFACESNDNDNRTVFVDVGGADGTTIAKIISAHPEIKPNQCIVQDTEAVATLAEKNPALPSGVKCMAHDFFTPQPIKSAKAYHLRAICHDWSDEMVVEILKNIVPAMAADSKVLIADNVLPEEGSGGRTMSAAMDLMMLCIGGKERSRAQFEKVLGKAGLKISEVYLDRSGFGVVEAVLT